MRGALKKQSGERESDSLKRIRRSPDGESIEGIDGERT